MDLSIYDQLMLPEEYSGSEISRNEAEYIYYFLLDKKIQVSLEVGLGLGFSAAHIISATKSILYSIDYQQSLNYNNIGLKNIKKLNLSSYLKFQNQRSHFVLPRLLKRGIKLDFAFIDGGHTFDDIFLDFYYIDLMLNNGGYVLFHDAFLRATQLVISWVKTNKLLYKVIDDKKKYNENPVNSSPNMIMFQKIGWEDKPWNHFNEFYFSPKDDLNKKNNNEEQNIYNITFNDKLYLIDKNDVKYLFDTKIVKTGSGLVLKFDKIKDKWIECNSEEAKIYKIACNGILMIVLYNRKIYYIDKNDVKSLFNTDVVKINPELILKFNNISKKWAKCNIEEIKIYELYCNGMLKDIWYNKKVFYINKKDIKSLLNTDVVKINSELILKYDNINKKWIKCIPEEIKTYELKHDNLK